MQLARFVASCFIAFGGVHAPFTLAQSNENLSIGAGSDGSSKESSRTSFGNVRDGDLDSFWSPKGSTGRISIKYGSEQSIASVRIIEASGSEGTIGDWELIDHQNGDLLATGSGAGTISFSAVSLKKVSFIINSASGTPKVAEFETFADSAVVEPTLAPTPTATPTPNPTATPTPEPSNVPTATPTPTSTPVPTAVPTATPTPTQPPVAGNGDCEDLVNNNSINWRESSLQSDQEIVECLKTSLGQPVGFGEKATGGFNPSGGSKLVVITNDNPEQQILDAISTPEHAWIVFDKDDFADETIISMHRLECDDASVLSALDGASESECRDPFDWCSANGVSSGDCLEEFYNGRLDDSALPIRNQLIDSNTTIDGRGSKAFFLFNGFKIGADSSGASTHVSSNVIVTNLEFRGAGHTEDHGLDPDMLRVTGESHDVWIHQNTFDTTGDAAFDIKVGGFATTISFNKLINVKRASLHGSSDSRAINEQITSTMHNNLFITEDAGYASNVFNGLRRVPLLRRGQTHIWNNVFYNYRKDIASIRVGGRMLFEDNLVLNNFEEAQTKSDEIDDFTGDGLFDFREGGLEVKNSDVSFADSNCNPIGSPASLDQSLGNTPDMNSAYNSASRNTIAANRLSAGNDLLDYVKATAGKGGLTPFVSSIADSQSDIISNAPASCQP